MLHICHRFQKEVSLAYFIHSCLDFKSVRYLVLFALIYLLDHSCFYFEDGLWAVRLAERGTAIRVILFADMLHCGLIDISNLDWFEATQELLPK